MQMILSSCDFRSLRTRDHILTRLPRPIEECRVLYLPNEKATPERIANGTYPARLAEFGFLPENVLVFNPWQPEKSLNLSPDLIYVSGGNTFAMLNTLRKTGFDLEIIRLVREGTLYVGGSAGAHLVTRDIAHLLPIDGNPVGMTDYRGLGLFDGILFCHYTEARRLYYERALRENSCPVYALSDDDFLTVEN